MLHLKSTQVIEHLDSKWLKKALRHPTSNLTRNESTVDFLSERPGLAKSTLRAKSLTTGLTVLHAGLKETPLQEDT
jgi:hypothetical protein